MTLDEIKLYFTDHFSVERLSLNEKNKELITTFKAPDQGKHLENILRMEAWSKDIDGETKFYLIKDKEGLLVAFFSIKCGLLYDRPEYEKLEGDELEFVELVFDQFNMDLPEKSDVIQVYYEYYDQISDERKDDLIKIAYQRFGDSEEEKSSPDGQFIKRVQKTYSAIEIMHLCKNINYSYDIDSMRGVALGAGLFWKKIIPKIFEVINMVGCKYLYLFAADHSDYEKVRSLIRYYKDDFKFEELQNLMIIKPDYDKRCPAMIQEVCDIEVNEAAFWARYN